MQLLKRIHFLHENFIVERAIESWTTELQSLQKTLRGNCDSELAGHRVDRDDGEGRDWRQVILFRFADELMA
jgi:hypothetical protein